MTVDPRTVIRDKVAEAMQTDSYPSDERFPWAGLSERERDLWRSHADAAIAAHLEALEQAARIETVEELDALPNDTAVLVDDCPARKHLGDWYFANDDGDGYGSRSLALYLPARVLYRPKES